MRTFVLMSEEIQITGNDDGRRLDKFLRKKFSQIPLSTIYRFLRQKKVKIIRDSDKLYGKRDTMLQKGDALSLYFDATAFGEPPPQKKPDFNFVLRSKFFHHNFHVHYEDEHLFVAEKPSGISVHPGSKTPWGRSLIDLFLAKIKSKNPDAPDPKLAHRLDKQTSGLILIAKNDAVLRKLTALFREGEIQKTYLALSKGRLQKSEGEITAKLLRTEGSKYTKICTSQSHQAKDARTLYIVKKYFSDIDASLVEATLDTGRMHQIRVHFASIGHPLAGDDAYGDFAWNRILQKQYDLKRHFLHAHKLAFQHPETEEQMEFESELPEDLKKLLPSK